MVETIGGHSAELSGGGLFGSAKRYLYKKFEDEEEFAASTGGGNEEGQAHRWRDISDVITDIQVVNLDIGEKIPEGYV
jgi:hypothetical protein